MEEAEILCEIGWTPPPPQSNKKLEKILRNLLDPNLKIKNDLYLNLLLTHWINKTDNNGMATDPNQDTNEMFFEWTIEASNLWNQQKVVPPPPVLSFALHVCCELSKNEKLFAKMNTENVFGKLAEVTQANEELSTNVTVDFIMLLSSVLEYATGVEWLLTTTYWNDVITIALKGRTKYIKKKAYQFIIKLLETTILVEQEFCEELVEILVDPLTEAAVQAESEKDSETEIKNIYESLKPSLDLISEVADTLLKNFNKNVLNFFVEIETPEAIQNVLNFSSNEDFSFDLLKIRFAFSFYQLCVKLEGIQQATHDEDTLADIGIMFELIRDEIQKDHVSCVLKICHYAHLLYCSLGTRIPLCIRKGESIEFQNQMILFQLIPILTFSYQLIGTKRSQKLLRTDDMRQDFYLKFAKISAIRTLDITSRWQPRLARRYDLIEDVIVCLQHIQKSKKIMDKEQAAFIFRPLIYSLKDIEWRLDDYQEKHMPLRGVKFFTIVIDTIIDLAESFDLTWKDCIETISVLDLACEIAQHEFLDYQVTVKFLHLLNLSISRCMSPNMALLMGTTNDSAISQVGTILYVKSSNNNHQIRTAALEVICTLALSAREKFPEFTNILFNADLPHLVVKMAVNDKEHDVRATAIKCIQALIQVEDVWEVYQCNHDFWDNILNILVNEPKGTVRKEAAILVRKIYEQYSFPDECLLRLYDIMTYAAIGDIHWEVKCKAISFWACTIKTHLRAQGMIDRGFPTHTFSKEKKKIITLTEAEKTRRVIKVLNQLSEIGCLYVLKTAHQDGFDEEVSRKTKVLTADMIKMIKAHKITCDNVDLSEPPSPASSFSPASSDSHCSPDRRYSLESSQSQFPDCSCDVGHSPASPGEMTLSSPEYTASMTPNTPRMSYTYSPSSYDLRNNQELDSQSSIFTEKELENFDIFNTTEKDLLILENDVDIGVTSEDNNMENSVYSDMVETEKMFDELLKLNEATLLEEICNPGYQIKTTPPLTTKQYLPPSEYVRFCLEVVDLKHDKKTPQLIQDLDEFDSLLDDLIKEFDLKLVT